MSKNSIDGGVLIVDDKEAMALRIQETFSFNEVVTMLHALCYGMEKMMDDFNGEEDLKGIIDDHGRAITKLLHSMNEETRKDMLTKLESNFNIKLNIREPRRDSSWNKTIN